MISFLLERPLLLDYSDLFYLSWWNKSPKRAITENENPSKMKEQRCLYKDGDLHWEISCGLTKIINQNILFSSKNKFLNYNWYSVSQKLYCLFLKWLRLGNLPI